MAAGLPPLPGTLHFTPGKTAPALPPRPPRHTPHPEEPAPAPRRLCRRMPPERRRQPRRKQRGPRSRPPCPCPKHRSRNPPRPRKGEWTAADAQAFEENAQPGSPQEERLRAALRLYGEEEEELPAPYAAPKKSYRGRLAVCLAAVLVLCALAAGIAWWRANSGQGPSPRGTAP